ncbi:MAG: hypothetical protein OEM05_06445 [Myxococcales bacterium]|nr:hypothetical protein [Myxococcales bacterium]
MKRGRISTVLLGGMLAASWVAPSLAVAQERSLEQVMGENFEGLQDLLVGLIKSEYAAMPDQLGLLHEHADELTKAIREDTRGDRNLFLMYAYSLRGHSADLKSIVEVLIARDEANLRGETLSTDDLREAAAAHFGGMVTMCVACHNRFRQRVVR